MLLEDARGSAQKPYGPVLAGLAVAGLLLAYGPVLLTCDPNPAFVATAAQAVALQPALLGICSAAGMAIIVVLLHSILSFRHDAATHGTRFTPLKEFIWALIPAAIMIGSAWPAIQPAVTDGSRAATVAAAMTGPACRPALSTEASIVK